MLERRAVVQSVVSVEGAALLIPDVSDLLAPEVLVGRHHPELWSLRTGQLESSTFFGSVSRASASMSARDCDHRFHVVSDVVGLVVVLGNS